jgi:D-aminopeptidase
MPVRLNITMDEGVYRRLKRELPPKRISAFIEDAVRARLYPDRRVLDAAYRAARRERWRVELSNEWAATETEGWPGVSAPRGKRVRANRRK